MEIYKLKFTILQEEILRFLFIKRGRVFNARTIAQALRVSPTAIAKSLNTLEKKDLITVSKESGRLSIELNKNNPLVFSSKRVENIKLLYESGIVAYLSENFPGTTIILFGSYSFGEDTINSDIDVAIIG